MSKKELKEKKGKTKEVDQPQLRQADADIIDPTDKKKPKTKF